MLIYGYNLMMGPSFYTLTHKILIFLHVKYQDLKKTPPDRFKALFTWLDLEPGWDPNRLKGLYIQPQERYCGEKAYIHVPYIM
jgi:hypothetical protein